ncbi:DNA alkylation repair protein [Agromyces sp. ISL-38]|uniref:DNA alkylation repair protein n=1 Tax=Agromyces sp. ISL-38 TaxID=2819107 RepID=UPI001BE848E1|nr:DNA alkylation repair protein [Agromyces sp. ISL-38]MBT2497521.1 DNA alkylation repair protein [Agromyces sp. ISL-38]
MDFSADASAEAVEAALAELASVDRAAVSARFFKTGPGQYGEGDRFIGVSVPATRSVVAGFAGLPPVEVRKLLESPVHEHRLAALLVMVRQFQVASRQRTRVDEAHDDDGRDDDARRALHEAYLAAVRAGRVNNWDLVDSSAEYLVGEFLRAAGRGDDPLLDELAASDSLWERRVAVLATFAFIRAGDGGPILRLAPRLLGDREDLMHKAVGWMLRELGKRVDRGVLRGFLDEYAARMPRTMLSYATEHLSPDERAAYRAQR